jgi:hypothetical protein
VIIEKGVQIKEKNLHIFLRMIEIFPNVYNIYSTIIKNAMFLKRIDEQKAWHFHRISMTHFLLVVCIIDISITIWNYVAKASYN